MDSFLIVSTTGEVGRHQPSGGSSRMAGHARLDELEDALLLEDCYLATRWVAEHAADLGGDADRLGSLATARAAISRLPWR